MTEQCKLKISIGQFKVKLVGSKDFIKEYAEKFSLEEKVKELVDEKVFIKNGTPKSSPKNRTTNGKNGQEVNQFSHVFQQSDGKTQLIFPKSKINILGNKKADKQAIIALLYLLGKELGTSNEETEVPYEKEIEAYKEITRITNSKKYDCNDGHIKHNLEKKDDWFLLQETENSRKQRIRLLPNGKNKAKELAKQLNDELSEQPASTT